jgi:hypothetical protein
VIHAISNYGERIVLRTKHPRKELLEHLGVRSAQKVYQDTDEGTFHVGYIAAGRWWTFYEVTPWRRPA